MALLNFIGDIADHHLRPFNIFFLSNDTDPGVSIARIRKNDIGIGHLFYMVLLDSVSFDYNEQVVGKRHVLFLTTFYFYWSFPSFFRLLPQHKISKYICMEMVMKTKNGIMQTCILAGGGTCELPGLVCSFSLTLATARQCKMASNTFSTFTSHLTQAIFQSSFFADAKKTYS